ncbi:hypothetical protein FALB51S_02530 [Frigidibacter albus]
MKTGPTEPRSTALTEHEEAAVVAFRRHTLLPLDDCLYALQPSIPHLTRSALHRASSISSSDNGIQFAEQPRNRNTITSRPMRFDMICEANGIEHRLTKPNHPWSARTGKQSGGLFSRAAVRLSG